MTPPPEAHLLHAAMQGDPEALELLLCRYQPSVTRFAQKFCATPDDVEDAVQETLWIAAQRIGTLRVAAAFGSWLFQIVRHQCFRLLRHAERIDFTNTLPSMLVSREDVERQITLHHDLVEALAALPPDYRQVVILRDVEDLPTAEVAVRLGVSMRAVKSRLHRARTTLRQMLESWKI